MIKFSFCLVGIGMGIQFPLLIIKILEIHIRFNKIANLHNEKSFICEYYNNFTPYILSLLYYKYNLSKFYTYFSVNITL